MIRNTILNYEIYKEVFIVFNIKEKFKNMPLILLEISIIFILILMIAIFSFVMKKIN